MTSRFPWRQLHLITSVLLMLASGILINVNTNPVTEVDAFKNVENDELNFIHISRMGWPLKFYSTIQTVQPARDDPVTVIFNKLNLLFNCVVGLAFLLLTGRGSEYLIHNYYQRKNGIVLPKVSRTATCIVIGTTVLTAFLFIRWFTQRTNANMLAYKFNRSDPVSLSIEVVNANDARERYFSSSTLAGDETEIRFKLSPSPSKIYITYSVGNHQPQTRRFNFTPLSERSCAFQLGPDGLTLSNY